MEIIFPHFSMIRVFIIDAVAFLQCKIPFIREIGKFFNYSKSISIKSPKRKLEMLHVRCCWDVSAIRDLTIEIKSSWFAKFPSRSLSIYRSFTRSRRQWKDMPDFRSNHFSQKCCRSLPSVLLCRLFKSLSRWNVFVPHLGRLFRNEISRKWAVAFPARSLVKQMKRMENGRLTANWPSFTPDFFNDLLSLWRLIFLFPLAEIPETFIPAIHFAHDSAFFYLDFRW